MRSALLFFLAFAFAVARPAAAQQSSESADEASTQIFVLATPHLSQIEDEFSPSLLDSLTAALREYRPDVIGIEALSGPQIAEMERRGGVYEQVYKQFAAKQLRYGKALQQSIDLSWREANARSDSLLSRLRGGKQAADEARLEAAASLLASYRLHTAALQWSYLPEDSRASQSLIPAEVADGLEELLLAPNESSSIALRLAHELELQRVYPVDDHLEKDLFLEIAPQLQEGLGDSTLQAIKTAPHLRRYRQLMEQGVRAGSLMPLYRYMNSPSYLEADVDVQWRVFLRTNLPSGADRSRLALWETRNLNIGARIRKASAHAPDGRVLVTIGASHKPFLDEQFENMLGVEVVNLDDVASN